MSQNPLLALHSYGQSIWLDFISRRMLESGELAKLIEEDGLSGITSNPSIFEKSIAESGDYDKVIRDLASAGFDTADIYRHLVIDDIQMAADIFRPVYNREAGHDGLVSLEVSPHLAYDTAGTIAEARSLWTAVNRPNVMIKVPATQAGLPAIEQLITEGINVNVTLLFGLHRYHQVANAYIAGLEARLPQGKPIHQIVSVASFFLSRIDVLVDPMLEKRSLDGNSESQIVRELRGQVAIASAKVAYKMYQEIFSQPRFRRLADEGGRPQRLLWASSSTKNPAYSDIKYVESLVGPHTVNMLPLPTLNAYRDHGQPSPRLETDLANAYQVLNQLDQMGIDIDQVTQQLEDEGVEKFVRAGDKLLHKLADRREKMLVERLETIEV